jgi:hypothetical protein
MGIEHEDPDGYFVPLLETLEIYVRRTQQTSP